MQEGRTGGASSFLAQPSAIPLAPPYLLRAKVLVDGIGDEPKRDHVLAIQADGRLGAIGARSAFGTRAANAVDVGVVLPGLVDCHAHVTLPSDRRPLAEQLRVSDARLALTAVRQLSRHLSSGYTTVRDCGARGTTGFDVRDAIAAGDFVAPRLLVCGRAVTHSGGHLSWCGSVADGPEEVRREVRILASQGADAIKLIASGGSTGGSPVRAGYSVAELATAVESAHSHGLTTLAHCRSTDSIRNALEAGVDVICHLEFLGPGALRDLGGGPPTGIPSFDPSVGTALAEARPWLDINPQSSGWDTLVVLRAKNEDQLTPAERIQRDGLELYYEAMIGVISHLRELGLADRIAFGTDAGPFDTEFGRPDYNLDLARRGGLAPMEAIRSLTSIPAAVCGRDDTVGSLKTGLQADLLVLNANPLEDPSALRDAAAVISAGRLVAQEPTGSAVNDAKEQNVARRHSRNQSARRAPACRG